MRGSKTDLPKTVEEEELTISGTDWGEMHVSLTTCHKTLDMTRHLKGLPDDPCQSPHRGFIVKGRKLVKYRDHEEIINGGDAFYMAPGHTTVTDAGTEWVESSPVAEQKRTNEAVARNLAAMDLRYSHREATQKRR